MAAAGAMPMVMGAISAAMSVMKALAAAKAAKQADKEMEENRQMVKEDRQTVADMGAGELSPAFADKTNTGLGGLGTEATGLGGIGAAGGGMTPPPSNQLSYSPQKPKLQGANTLSGFNLGGR